MLKTKEIFISNRKAVREAFGKSDNDVLRDIEIIREWIKTQPHLPEVPNDNMIEIFLVTNKFSIKRTKEKLDMYYTIRALIPELYENSNPRLPQTTNVPEKMGFERMYLNNSINSSLMVLLPRQTEDLYRMYAVKLTGPAEDFDPYNFCTYLINLLEMKIQHDAAVGDVFLFDHQNLTVGHILKVSPVLLKKMSAVLEKVFSNRIKGIHLINWPPYIDMLLRIVKTAFKAKIFERIHLHNSLEELYNYVPREILPKDYGGDERSMDELTELCKEMLRENFERFDKLDQMRVNEDVRPNPLKNDEVLGYYGNFKKLDVD